MLRKEEHAPTSRGGSRRPWTAARWRHAASMALAGGLGLAGLALSAPSARAEEPRCLPPLASLDPAPPSWTRPSSWPRPALGVAADHVGLASLKGAPVQRVSTVPAGGVRLTFVGHSTFLLETAGGVSVETDYNDYVRSGRVPTIATMNKAHSTHYSLAPDPGIAHVLRGWSGGGGPRELSGAGPAKHRLTVGDLTVRNVTTNIRDWAGGTEFDGNSIFVFEVGDLCVAHLGHLHHVLEPEHLRALGRVDVVLVPVDGGWTMDQAGMAEVVEKLSARIVVPMHFFTSGTLERFLDRMQGRFAIERRGSSVLEVSPGSLPERATIVVLPGR